MGNPNGTVLARLGRRLWAPAPAEPAASQQPVPPNKGGEMSTLLIRPGVTSLSSPARHDPGGPDRDLPHRAEAELAGRLQGPLLLPGDPGYPQECAGYNLAADRRPALVVGATGAADVMAAVDFATRHGLAVAVLCTGHGASKPAEGALLITTRRMQGVRVDPFARVARIEAGVRWEQVIHETAAFGLAPLSGSSPQVGAVGFTLGGGLGLLGRAYGYSADHVRSIDVVTAHGMLRTATPDQFRDLFWALRGGTGNFGVVTSMEIGLFPVPRIYGGGIYFPGSASAAVFTAYRRWVRTLPDEMGSSIALTRFPYAPAVPQPLRGRFVVHVRVAFAGSAADGERLVAPLRRAGVPILDTVADLPYVASGAVHNDPTEPFGLHERTTHLPELDEDAVDTLIDVAGPDTTCTLRLVELRHLGGALGRAPEVPNAVGNRDARFLLYTAGETTEGEAGREGAQRLIDRMAPWSTGRASINFLGSDDTAGQRVRDAFDPADYRKLVAIKRAYDPENIFRINHNIPPAIIAG